MRDVLLTLAVFYILLVGILVFVATNPPTNPTGSIQWTDATVIRMTQGSPTHFTYQDDTITARTADGTTTFASLDSNDRDTLWGFVVVGDVVRERLVGGTVCTITYQGHSADTWSC